MAEQVAIGTKKILIRIHTESFIQQIVKDPLRPFMYFLFTSGNLLRLDWLEVSYTQYLACSNENVMAARQKDFAIYRSIVCK